MLWDPWLLVMTCTGVGVLALAGRRGLEAWSLYQLGILTRESESLLRCWAAIDRLPAEALTSSMRCLFGRIMYQRVKRARCVHPDHPFLRDQQLQIARFVARPRVSGSGADPDAEAVRAALADLRQVLEESAADGLLSAAERQQCEASVAKALTDLEIAHHRQAALQAEYLQRIPQAIAHLRAALHAADPLAPEDTQRRELARRLHLLESDGLLAAS